MKQSIIKVIISSIILAVAFLIHIEWLKITLFLLSYIIVAYEVIIEAAKKIKKGDFFEEEFLMTVASIGALIIGEYPEAIAVMLLYGVGEIFEEYAEDKSRKSIKSLIMLKPDIVNVKVSEEIIQKKPEEVRLEEIIIVKPGERVPLDGIVVNGEALIDTSALTRRICTKES